MEKILVFYDGNLDGKFISSTMSKLNQHELRKEMNIGFINSNKRNIFKFLDNLLDNNVIISHIYLTHTIKDRFGFYEIDNYFKEKNKNNNKSIALKVINQNDYKVTFHRTYSNVNSFNFYEELINIYKEEKGKVKVFTIRNRTICEEEVYIVDVNKLGVFHSGDREIASNELITRLEKEIEMYTNYVKENRRALNKELKTKEKLNKSKIDC